MERFLSYSEYTDYRRALRADVVSMRGTPEWRQWLNRLAEHCRNTPSATIDRALAELARREGFEGPPPRL